MLGGKRISRDREADEASYGARRGYEEWTPLIEDVIGGLLAQGVKPSKVERWFREGEYEMTDLFRMWRQMTQGLREPERWGEWSMTGMGMAPLKVE